MKKTRNTLLVLAILAYIELLNIGLPISSFLPKINKSLSDRHLKINDSASVWLQLKYPLSPELKISNLELTYNQEKESKTILKANHVHVVPSIAGIIFQDYSINYLDISSSKIYLDNLKEMKAKSKKKDKDDSVLDLDKWVKEFNLVDVSLFKNHKDKESYIHFDKANYSGTFTNSNLSLQGIINGSPIYLNANTVFTNSTVSLRDIYAEYKRTKLRGEFFIDKGKDKYNVSSKFSISNIDTTNFASNDKSGNSLPEMHREFNLESFNDFSFNIEGMIKKITHGNLEAENINIAAITSTNNNLQINVTSNNFIKGSASSAVTLSGDNVDAKLTLKDVSLEDLVSLSSSKVDLKGGKLNINSSLKSKGNTTKQIIGSLSGTTLVEISNAQISSDINILGGNLSQIIPFAKNKPLTELTCSVLNFSITKGVMTSKQGIGVRTTEADITGDGKINLNNEKINFTIKPESRGMDIKILNLAQLIKISGTISNPKVEINPEGVVKEATSIIAGVLTGGISTVTEGLTSAVSSFSDDNTPCSYAKSNKQ